MRTTHSIRPFLASLWTGSLLVATLSARLAAGQEAEKSVSKPAGEAAGQESPKLPPGVLARVNGKDVTLQDYSRYLFARFGKSRLGDLVHRILVEEEARRLEIQLSPEDVETEVERRIESRRQGIFRGDRARLAEDLRLRGLTLDDYKEMLRQTVSYELLQDSCIVKSRQIGDSDIKAEFERTYGEGGEQYELRHLLIAAREDGRGTDAAGRPLPSVQDARKKAAGILAQLRQGADLVELVRAHSDDLLTRKNDGRIPLYRSGAMGEEFHRAVRALDENNRLSGVVRSTRGFHIIYLIQRKTTKLEEKRPEILDHLKTRAPTARERQEFLRKLREKATVVR